jgi:hypothetical protein
MHGHPCILWHDRKARHLFACSPFGVSPLRCFKQGRGWLHAEMLRMARRLLTRPHIVSPACEALLHITGCVGSDGMM